MKIIPVLAVLLIGLTGCSSQAPSKAIQTPTPKLTSPVASPSEMPTPGSTPMDTFSSTTAKPTSPNSLKNSQHPATPDAKPAPSHSSAAGVAASLSRFNAVVANAPALTTGSYLLSTPDSIQRTVQWRGSDVTYVALDAGFEFGWAYFNGTYYERYTARFRLSMPTDTAPVWYDSGPALPGVAASNILDYPKVLAKDLAQEAVAVSVSKNNWTIIGRVHTSLYTSAALQYETMQLDSAGHLVSITLPGLRLTVTPTAPDPLIKANEITGPGGSENTPQP